MTDTETSQNISSIFIANGKQKKHLQPSTKYPMRLCKACNIMVVENYLSNHKKTSKHLANQQKKEENDKKNDVNYISDKLNQEIKDLEYKLTSFQSSLQSIIQHIDKMSDEMVNLENQRADIYEKMQHQKHHMNNMDIERKTFENDINTIKIQLDKKRTIYNYMNEL
jgi:chromosome segregation ATPase